MFESSRILPGSSALRSKMPRYGRTALIALMLVLAFASMGPSPTAQAAPVGDTQLRFFMLAVPEGHLHKPICMGELLRIHVLVYRVKEINGVDSGIDTLPGISVTGVVENPKIGTISPNPNTTSAASSVYPGAAEFVFTSQDYGETNINFIGLIAAPGWFGTNFRSGAEKVTAQVDVNVIHCKEKVTTTIQLHDVAEDITMITDQAVMTRDEAGTFTGSTTLYYAYSMAPPCDHTVSATDSQVDLTGQLDEDGGQFTATETFQPTTLTTTIKCPLVDTMSRQSQVTVNPLTFTVASSGGVSTQSFLGGMARIVVVPEEDKAAAFNVGNLKAHTGSPSQWWAMLWDVFPGLNGALLALR